MRPRDAFTLVELLVVIGIIGVLTAILFPVFARTRERARMTACTSNCRQLGSALLMYAEDYDETLPGWPDPRLNPVYQAGYDCQMVVPLVNAYLRNYQVWVCPSGYRTTFGPPTDRFECNLGYNEYLYNTAHGIPPSYGHNLNRLAVLSGTRAGVASIAVMADSSLAGIFNDWGDFDGIQLQGEPFPGFGLTRLKYANGWTGPNPCTSNGPRHPDHGANIVFADGHAKFVVGGSLRGNYGPSPSDPSVAAGNTVEWPVVNPLNVPPP